MRKLAVPDVQLPPMNFKSCDLSTLGQVIDWGYGFVKAGELSEITKRGKDCIVFIIDTGIANHDDLNANRLIQYDKNFTADTEILHPHGTHCAGIVAASNNEIGIVGIAPESKLVNIQVLDKNGSGSYVSITNAINYVADLELLPEHAHMKKIISMSLGGPSPYDPLHVAIQTAISKGVFIVVAAGNSGYADGKNTVNYPGKYAEVITVASLDPDSDNITENQQVANYSSAGEEVDISAPGTNILSTVLNNGYATFSGTSMACPHIAGLCALILTADKSINSQELLQNKLKSMAIDLLTAGFDVKSGAGAAVLTSYIKEPPVNPFPLPTPTRKDPVTMNMSFKNIVKVQYFNKENISPVDININIQWKHRFSFENAYDLINKITNQYFENTLVFTRISQDMYAVLQLTKSKYINFILSSIGNDQVLKLNNLSLTDANNRQINLY